MNLAQLGLFVNGQGAIMTLNQFTGSATNAGVAGGRLEQQAKRLQSVFGGLAAYFAVRQLAEYADTWTLISSRIQLVTHDTQTTMAVQQRLYEIAQRTRNTMAATSVLYTRLALNANELGRSHSELLNVVESVNAAMLRSGATGVEAAQGMRQLAQALGKGKLDGDEFRTVMEAMPEVARAISQELGVTRGELYKLSAAGKITANEIINALLKQHDAMVESAKNMTFTFGQSMIMFANSIERVIGLLNQATKANYTFKESVDFAVEHMGNFVAMIAGAVTAWYTYRLMMFSIIGIYKLMVMWSEATKTATIAVVFWQRIMYSSEAIIAFFQLAAQIRSVAAATALLGMVSKGVVGFVAFVAAVTAGYFAYSAIVKRLTAEEAEYTKAAKANLDKKIGSYVAPKDEITAHERARLRFMMDFRGELAQTVREAAQTVAMSRVQGMAADELQNSYDSLNAMLEKQLQLQEKVTTGTITQADAYQLMKEAGTALAKAQDSVNDALHRREMIRVSQGGQDNQRELQQQLELSGKIGFAQEELRIHYEAVNRAIKARRELIGDVLEKELENIRVEEAMQMQLLYMHTIAADMASAFSDAFTNILDSGLAKMKNLVTGIKTMILRMFAELAATAFMKKVGSPFAAALGAVFSSAGAVAASPTVGKSSANTDGIVPVEIAGITVEVHRSLMSQFARVLGPALAGFGIGSAIGGLTTNRGLGTVGGALGGALAGAIMGSVVPGIGTAVGAAVGGLAGAIGGLISSNKNLQDKLDQARDITAANNLQLSKLRDAFYGTQNRVWENILKVLGDIALVQKILREHPGIHHTNTSAGWDILSEAEKKLLLQAASDLGIKLLDDKGRYVAGSLEALADAIDLAIKSITQFANTASDLQAKQAAYNKIFGVADTSQQRAQDSFAVLNQLAPALMKKLGLSNLDLGTEAGRNALREGFKEIYNLIASGNLSPELLGAFKDKNELLDVILKTIDAFDSLNQQLTKVTTDFPRAMDIIYYEQKFGRYGKPGRQYSGNDPNPEIVSGDRWNVSGGITIINEAGDSGEDLLQKLERAALVRGSRGGFVTMPTKRLS